MRLNDFQMRFCDLMLSGPEGLNNMPEEFAALFAAGGIPLCERLKVYRSNIVGGIAENLCKGFPLLEKLVGNEFLIDMVRRFVMAHPPESGCLNFYGRGFDEFIGNYAPARNLPYLPDMARLEIAMNDAYYAQDDHGMKAEELARIAPEALGDITLPLRDSVQLVRSDYALDALRDYCLLPVGEAPPINRPSCLMVYRPKLEVVIVPLEQEEYILLESLNRVTVLGEAVEEALAVRPDFDLETFFRKHVDLESFRALPTNNR